MPPETVLAVDASPSVQPARAPHLSTDVARGAGSTSVARADDKSIVLAGAYEEYCRLRESGEQVDPTEFARRYSRYQRSLLTLIDVHQLIVSNPELLEQARGIPWPELGSDYLGFELIDELGQGTFARVYLASETELADRLVAVKIADDSAEEAQRIARLGGHPNIVPIHSVRSDAETGRTLICMPYVGRATLFDLLDRVIESGVPRLAQEVLPALTILDEPQPIAADQVAKAQNQTYVRYVMQLGAEIADALAHTHERGICHGDLKPSNVLLVSGGRPMLVDFNLSLEMGDVSRLGGTMPYIAPEQLQALKRARDTSGWNQLDERCDLFSLGAMLYELLTGRLPFGNPRSSGALATTTAEQLELRRQGPLAIRTLNPLVDRRTAAIVERCLRFDPADRPSSAKLLAREIRAASSPLARGISWVETRPRTATALVVLAAVVLLSAGVWLNNRPSPGQAKFAEATRLYHAGDYAGAVPMATAALDAGETAPELYFLRGSARQKSGLYMDAIQDFRWAERAKPDPLSAACRAYCLAQTQNYEAAIATTRVALKDGLEDPARTLSNLAHCQRLSGKLDEAITIATEAIQSNDQLQSPFLTRASAIRTICMNHATASIERAAQDIQRAIELGPPSGALFLEAAYIEHLRAQVNPAHQSAANLYLCDAIANGVPRRIVESHPWFKGVPIPESVVPAKDAQRSANFLLDPLGS